MIKYLEWFGLLPIAIVPIMMSINSHQDHININAANQCYVYLSNLLILIFLYILLRHVKIHRYLSVAVAVFMWIAMFFLRKRYLKKE